MAKKRAEIDKGIFAKTDQVQEPIKRTSEVKGKSKITLYIADQVQDDLDSFWVSQPRENRMSKSKIAELAIAAWLENNT